MPDFRYYPETPGNPYRLGRHQMHSALPPAKAAARTCRYQPLRSVEHKRLCAPFDQNHCDPQVIAEVGGDPQKTALGNCTMNAAYGTLMTAPFHRKSWAFTEDDCVRGYHLETLVDNSQIPGEWPSDDTGSNGGWSMLVLEQAGLITGWRHTRSMSMLLSLLMHGPVSAGMAWYRSMFTVDGDDEIVVDPTSGLAGGHQIELVGVDVDNQRVRMVNSWGAGWGDGGYAWFGWHDLAMLIESGGDVVQPAL